jgi:hypothetical protein
LSVLTYTYLYSSTILSHSLPDKISISKRNTHLSYV